MTGEIAGRHKTKFGLKLKENEDDLRIALGHHVVVPYDHPISFRAPRTVNNVTPVQSLSLPNHVLGFTIFLLIKAHHYLHCLVGSLI